jgi:hypothetical protein
MPESRDRFEPMPGLLELPSFIVRKIPPERRRLVLGTTLVVLVGALAGAAAGIPAMRAHTHAEEVAQARTFAAEKRRLLARYAQDARPRAGRGPAAAGLSGGAARASRRRLVASLEAAVLADARSRASRGTHLDYRHATCYGYPKEITQRAPQDDLARPSAVMQCLAISAQVRASATTTGSMIGQPFRARVDFEHGTFSWCQIVQMPGEKSLQRRSVLRVPAACGGSG